MSPPLLRPHLKFGGSSFHCVYRTIMTKYRSRLVAVCCVLIVLALVFVWRQSESASFFNLVQYLTNLEESKANLERYLKNIPGYTPDSGCWIEYNGSKNAAIKRNATIHCPGNSYFPALPAMLPDGTKFSPSLQIKNGRIFVPKGDPTYAEELSKQIPGSWAAPQSKDSTSMYDTIGGGCTHALYQDGYLSAMCATGDVTHKMFSTNAVAPKYSIIAYPTQGVALGNSNGHLAPERDAGNY